MSSAPRTRPIIMKCRWAFKPVAVIGRYVDAHGAHCTIPIFDQAEQPLNAEAWAEIPAFDGAHPA
jgi:hypothetical protein